MALTLCPPASRVAAGAPPDREIRQLITNLGSDRFADREAAMRKLVEMDEAESALHAARAAVDLEVRRRVAEILRVRQSQRALRGLVKAKALGKPDARLSRCARRACAS